MERKFRSKVDWWISAIMIFVLATQLFVVLQIVPELNNGTQTYVALGTVIGVFFLVLAILLRTYYSVYRGALKIVSGPFWWTVKLADINSVRETRSPLSSPALSLERIRIHYGKRRWVMVSPADKAGFYDAIGHRPDSDDSAMSG